jgi:hypothetical protein
VRRGGGRPDGLCVQKAHGRQLFAVRRVGI